MGGYSIPRAAFKFIKYRKASSLRSLIKLEGEKEHKKASREVLRRTVRAVGLETGRGPLYTKGAFRVLMPQPPTNLCHTGGLLGDRQ